MPNKSPKKWLYDYETAIQEGLSPDSSGHWPSRVPNGKNEGLLLKSILHPTWNKTVSAERRLGYDVIKKGDRWYSVPSKRKHGKYKRGGK